MPTSKSNKILKLFYATIILLGFSSCYENAEGCLDPNSTNYDVTADVDCDDCCLYPTLSLLVAYVLGDAGYNNIDTVSNDLEKEFVIEDLQAYFSDLVIKDEVEEYRIEETFDYTDINGNDQQAIDDIVLTNPSGFRYTLGTFTKSNDYTSFSIGLGIPAAIDEAQSITVTSDHPLIQAGDSLYISDQNQYVNSWILIRQIGVHEVADTLQIPGNDFNYLFNDLLISQARGSSLDISIKIDYMQLIEGIDYTIMTKTQVIDKISENLKIAISTNF